MNGVALSLSASVTKTPRTATVPSKLDLDPAERPIIIGMMVSVKSGAWNEESPAIAPVPIAAISKRKKTFATSVSVLKMRKTNNKAPVASKKSRCQISAMTVPPIAAGGGAKSGNKIAIETQNTNKNRMRRRRASDLICVAPESASKMRSKRETTTAKRSSDVDV